MAWIRETSCPPFIRESDIGRFMPVITEDDEVLEFPPLREFRNILNT